MYLCNTDKGNHEHNLDHWNFSSQAQLCEIKNWPDSYSESVSSMN